MNGRFLFAVLVLLLMAGAVTLFTVPYGSDESSTGPQEMELPSRTAPVVVDRQSRDGAELEEIEDTPVPPADTFEQDGVTSLDTEEQSTAAQEEYAVALVAEIEGPLPVPLQTAVVATLREFAYEPVDPAWSVPTENRIFDAISATPELAAIDIAVECRATMCLMRIAHPPSEPTGPVLTGATIIDIIQRSGLAPTFLNAYPDEYGNPVSRAILKEATTQSIDSPVAATG